ncbi:hypothetical protein [Nitrosovibrio sp. Nv6]|uniref:hypothetical protein n=1 Tax=Nitrosovibrio sp. Nv6 TaxID=1855340 RepID=UPI0008C11A45|nr:hypothetical protein [Nitrosovibrio sp. Nv6]SEO66289.1 hypothetical protein SAMN05216316_0740 [Nitrosovibrio sp. Nv6]
MTQQLFCSVLYFRYAILMSLAFSQVTHAQQTEALQLHRPDNHATQKESISGGACIVQTGAFPVGFNAYVVPDGDHPSYPPFCSPVPAGALNLVIDILASEFREMPLAVRLMKIENGEEREVLSVPAVEYTSGNIPLVVNLEPLGRYRVLLVGDDASGNTGNLVTIPLDVRKAGDYVHTGNGGTGWGFLLLVVGLAGLAGGLIHFWRPKSATTGTGASS